MVVLVIAEHDNASLKPSTLNTVTAAAQCGSDIHILIAGHQCSAAVDAAAKVSGVSKVLVAEAPHFADGLAENIAEQALAIAGGYSHILAPASAYGKNVLPRVAARLDVGQISEIIRIESPDTFDRTIYAGNAIATVQSSDPVKVITVRTTCFQAAETAGAAAVEAVTPVAGFDKVRFVSRELAASDRPELTSARVVVAGGRGLDSAEDFELLGQLGHVFLERPRIGEPRVQEDQRLPLAVFLVVRLDLAQLDPLAHRASSGFRSRKCMLRTYIYRIAL